MDIMIFLLKELDLMEIYYGKRMELQYAMQVVGK